MQHATSLWVLGHKVRIMETDESYALVQITSPPHVPGPAPHYHKTEHEFFLVLKGTLDVMRDGHWQSATAGTFVELPPGTAHTFINTTDEDVVWITGWRPKGFQRFFEDFGVPADQTGARERSVSGEILQKVVAECEAYGMYVRGPGAAG